MNDEQMEKVEGIARTMFTVGAREVAMMALDGELNELLFGGPEAVVERARERAMARTDLAVLREPSRG